jgi:hypothetical protein
MWKSAPVRHKDNIPMSRHLAHQILAEVTLAETPNMESNSRDDMALPETAQNVVYSNSIRSSGALSFDPVDLVFAPSRVARVP